MNASVTNLPIEGMIEHERLNGTGVTSTMIHDQIQDCSYIHISECEMLGLRMFSKLYPKSLYARSLILKVKL